MGYGTYILKCEPQKYSWLKFCKLQQTVKRKSLSCNIAIMSFNNFSPLNRVCSLSRLAARLRFIINIVESLNLYIINLNQLSTFTTNWEMLFTFNRLSLGYWVLRVSLFIEKVIKSKLIWMGTKKSLF